MELEKVVYRIIEKESGVVQGCYSRSYRTEYEFKSADEARSSNVHGIFKDENKYKIQKYKVSYELLEDEVKQ